MSFVSIIARENFISIMSDGQETSPNGEVIANNIQKFLPVGNKAFVAFTGQKDTAFELGELAKYQVEEGLSLRKTAEFIQEILIKDIAETNVGFIINMCIGGINEKGKVEFFSLSNRFCSLEEMRQKYKQPQTPEDISYSYLVSNEISSSNINFDTLFLSGFRRHGYNTPKAVKRVHNDLNTTIQSIDNTVNNKTFYLLIKK